MKLRPADRRRFWLPTVAILVLLLGYLLWPLSSREWEIEANTDALARKEEILAAERTVFNSRREATGSPHAVRPPNVVLIVADDLARVDVSRYGAAVGAAPVPTPFIDSIGEEGVTFTDANATATICSPSRAAILTGRYQQRYGFELQPHDRYARNRLEYLAFRYLIDTDPMQPIGPQPVPGRRDIALQGLPAGEITMAELLKARGYRTAAIGKWHLGYELEFSPLRRGFEEHYGFYEAFSLYAPVDDPNVVNTPIDDFSDKHMWARERRGASAIVHNDQVVQDDEYLTFSFAERAVEYIESHGDEQFFLYLPFSAPHTPLQAPRRYVDAVAHIEDPIRRTYAAMIAALDDAVGQVLAAVEDAGIAEDTIIVFTSDNGGTSYLGVTDNGPLAGGKFTNFQGGIAVPLLVRYPRLFPRGVVVGDPVSTLDVFATVESVTAPGGEAGDQLNIDGVDLLPVALGRGSDPPHEALFWRSIYNKAIRLGEWKLIVTTGGSPDLSTDEPREELYNLSLDPSERYNVATEHPEVVADLRARLAVWESTTEEPLWPPVMHFWHQIWGRRLWFAI